MNGQFSGLDRLQEIPLWGWVLLLTLLLGQAVYMFNDARKRGLNAWAWGAFGLLNVPSSLIVYRLVIGTREAGGRGFAGGRDHEGTSRSGPGKGGPAPETHERSGGA